MHPKVSNSASQIPVPPRHPCPLVGALPPDLRGAAAALHLAVSDYAKRSLKVLAAPSLEEGMRLRAEADRLYAQAIRDFALQIVDHADARRPRCA